MKQSLRGTVVLCASLAMLGCSTLQPLDGDGEQLRATLKRGDHVQVVTGSGEQLQFYIDSLDETGLRGGGHRIAYADIHSISRKRIATGTTALAVLGIVAVGALAAGGGGGGSSY
jgi:hypothetical protein